MRLLEELVGCLCRSEVTVAGGPRWSGFLSTCERFAGPNTELSCCPAPDAMRVLPKARGLLTQQGASLQSMSRRKPHMRSPKDALSCTMGCCNQILPMIHRAIKPAGHVLRGNIDLKSQRQQPSQKGHVLGGVRELFSHIPPSSTPAILSLMSNTSTCSHAAYNTLWALKISKRERW